MAINHLFSSGIADGADATLVQPGDWNDDHVISGTSLQLQFNNAGSLTGLAGTSWDNTNRSLTLTGATVTTSKPILDLSQTWNNAAVTFTALKLNVTNTAAAANANNNLLDLQVGGVSQVGIAYYNDGFGTLKFNFPAANVQFNAGGVSLVLGGFGGGTTFSGQSNSWNLISYGLRFFSDTYAYRDAAAGVFAFTNSTPGAAGIRVYNTTDQINTNAAPTNYERGVFDWTTTANTLTIGTQAGGTGTNRNLAFVAASSVFSFGDGAGNTATWNLLSNGRLQLVGNPGVLYAPTFSGNEFLLDTSSGDVGMARNAAGVAEINSGSAGTLRDLKLRTLTGSGATVTTSTPLIDMSQTWNAGAVTFTGLKLNVTQTAAATGSKVFDFQIGGTSFFYNDSTDGTVAIRQLTAAVTGDTLSLYNTSGVKKLRFIADNANITFANISTSPIITTDAINSVMNLGGGTVLIGDEATRNFAIKNGTSSTGLRVYNTTDTTYGAPSANYERGVFDWTTTANTLTIGTQAGGTGTGRNVAFVRAGTNVCTIDANNFWYFGAGCALRIQGGGGGSNTVGLANGATSVLQIVSNATLNLGSTAADGWIQWGGQTRVTADVTATSTTTLANITGLSVSVAAGRTYSFEAYLSFTDAAAGGIKAAIAGTATATDIRYDGYCVDSGANGIKGNAQASALGTAVADTVTTGTAGVVIIKGTITVNAAGTLTVQHAQNTSNGTATTIKRGSYFIVHDMP